MKKEAPSACLVWLDLEMTGLDIRYDSIIEIAALVTTNDLQLLDQGISYVIQHTQEQLARMSSVVSVMHGSSGLTAAALIATNTCAYAEEQVLTYLQQYCTPRTVPLCGNTIWQDRVFLKKYMPQLEEFFHYRMIDVSTIKELVRRWYGSSGTAWYEKKSIHRATEDVMDSISELQYYRKHFFVGNV